MAQPSPLNDPDTYKKIAVDSYARAAAQGVQNPKAVLVNQEAKAMGDNSNPSAESSANDGPPAGMTQAQFSGYVKASPDARTAQKQALIKKLAAMHDQDASEQKVGD